MSCEDNSQQIVDLLADMVLKYIKEHPEAETIPTTADADSGKAA